MNSMESARSLSSILFWIGCFLSAAASAQDCSDPDSLRLGVNGTISRDDFETYVEVPFTVPPGTRSVAVEFDYDRSNRTTIDLGLLDPNGFRGWSGGNKRSFRVTANSATASYSTGPLTPGQWAVLLGVPNIRPGQVSEYTLDIALSCQPLIEDAAIAADRGPDWYRGDLHVHTGHSDGSCASVSGVRILCPTFMSVGAAYARGLDFLAVSDHNSVSQNSNNEILQAYFDSLLLIPGREITTFYGHANVFGSTEFIDFRLQPNQGRGADFLFDQVADLGALLSVNHPGSPSGEDCMGCGWTLADTDFRRVPAMEVVNAGFVDLPRGRAHLDYWHQKLNLGFRITGIGGSDSHLADRDINQASAIGNPTTWVFAEALSVQALLDGIRSGKVFIEVTGGSVRLLEFTVNGVGMGEETRVTSPARLQAAWESEQALRPIWIHQGRTLSLSDSDEDSNRFSGEIGVDDLELPGWLRLNLVDESGNTRLIGNPVYLLP